MHIWFEAWPSEWVLHCVAMSFMKAPGPGISDPFHFDMDSIVTVDVMLSSPGPMGLKKQQ